MVGSSNDVRNLIKLIENENFLLRHVRRYRLHRIWRQQDLPRYQVNQEDSIGAVNNEFYPLDINWCSDKVTVSHQKFHFCHSTFLTWRYVTEISPDYSQRISNGFDDG